jgi:parallel beta-helix repeat protein
MESLIWQVITNISKGDGIMGITKDLLTQNITNVETIMGIWNGTVINVKDYGALGDGETDETDDTIAIQQAFNFASASNIPVFFPSGTFIATELTIPSGLKILGTGPSRSIIKRKDDSDNNQYSLLKASYGTSIGFDGVGFDGNKENQTVNAHNILISYCSNISINNCRSFNSCRSGLFMEYSTNENTKDRSIVQASKFDNNAEMGMYVNNETQLLITNSEFISNTGSGFSTLGSSNTKIDFISNTAAYNGYHGVCFSGHNSNDPTQNDCSWCEASNNNIHDNKWWGLTFQCTGGVVSGNNIRKNGTTSSHAGLLLNGWNTTITGNYIDGNYYYGIDMGDTYNCIFTSNTVVNNGNPTDGGIGINVESAEVVGIVGNFFYNNGNASSGYQIDLHGIGGADVTAPFRGLNTSITVENNTVSAGNSSQYGIYVDTSSFNVLVTGNQMIGFSDSVHALQYACISGPKCTNNHSPFIINPTIVAAASMVIPDDGDFIFVAGTTTINEILTDSSALFKEKVSRIDLTNSGSGYSSIPTVTIIGGGGSGATAQAYVELATGQLTSIAVTSGGSGYTSPPTVSITGGGGTNAAAVTYVGCNNYPGRRITLKFQSSVTLNSTGNIKLVGGSFAALNTSTLVLIGEYGQWFELSRSTI